MSENIARNMKSSQGAINFSTLLHLITYDMIYLLTAIPCNKWVPVITAWRVLGVGRGEGRGIRGVGGDILNKQSRTAETGWYSSLGVGRGANNSSP
jgi:hypothetical protein